MPDTICFTWLPIFTWEQRSFLDFFTSSQAMISPTWKQHRPELIKCDLFFCSILDHSFFFPAFGLFSFFHMRMKFLYFFHYFFEVQSLEEDLRLVSHMRRPAAPGSFCLLTA